MRTSIYTLVSALLVGTAASAAGQLTETFDEWTDDGSYNGTAVFVHPGVGTWVSNNALAGGQNARSGNAVRFDRDAPAPWLQLGGMDGGGIVGGVGSVSFYYRHWDGDANRVAFQLQYRIAGGTWTDAGPETVVPSDTLYRRFDRALNLTGDNVEIRILSTAQEERLLIDDFAIGDGGGGETPVVGFVTSTQTIDEAVGTIQIPIQISPPAAATVEVAVVAGNAGPGIDFVASPTTLVFSAESPVRELAVTVVDDWVLEGNETAEFALTAISGAEVGPGADRFTLTLLDNESSGPANDLVFTVMAANITSGNYQSYEDPGIRIFQALDPDIVAIQEFNVDHPQGVRGFVDDTFGTNFTYMIEGGDEQIPNGVISRWPITASGEWNDPQVGNRDFAWATIDIPGDTDLHVVSVHLHSSGGASSRAAEAAVIVSEVQRTFPAGDYIALAGDFNTGSRTESCIQTLKSVFVDRHVPVDQLGDDDTNAGRNKPYDWVMVNPALDALHEPVTVGGRVFSEGIVFDTRLWSSPPAPALAGDSGAFNMQHMAVMKAFFVPGTPISPFRIQGEGDSAEMRISVLAEPDWTYTVEYSDNLGAVSEAIAWYPFLLPAQGSFRHAGPAAVPHVFIDDFGPTTSGGRPDASGRAYRVRMHQP